MSFFKFKSLVLFIKIVTKLLLLRPFEILYMCCKATLVLVVSWLVCMTLD